jgi:hypothetical protein
MAKNQLPSVDVVETKTATPTAPPAFTIDAQAAGQVEGFVTREVYAKKLTRKQGRKLTDKCRELMDSGATLEDGKHVTNKSMVVKWLIENHC